MYAIFRAAGKQFRAEKGKTLRLPRLDAEPGTKLTFDEVLLASDGETVRAGTPLVKGASVTAEVVAEGKDPKIYVFKFKRRKNYRRKTGHRQHFTEVRVTGLKLG
jgi:large subunit ribosomal protein L21